MGKFILKGMKAAWRLCVSIKIYVANGHASQNAYTQQCCSQPIFGRGWSTKHQSILVVLSTTSNQTEVMKDGGRPPFHPLATTLTQCSHASGIQGRRGHATHTYAQYMAKFKCGSKLLLYLVIFA